MKRLTNLLIFIFTFSVFGYTQNMELGYEENELVFEIDQDSFLSGLSLERLQAKPEFKLLVSQYEIGTIEYVFQRLNPKLNRYVWVKHNRGKTDQLLTSLKQFTWVESVEKLPKHELFFTPSDLNSKQWGLKKINAEAAWDYVKGSKPVKVAVVDDAVYIDHEDLKDNVWTNPGEISGNGIDDDKNGYVDDVQGWDAANSDNDPRPNSTARLAGFQTHGTHVSGIAAGRTNNNKGMASLSFNVTLIPIKTSYIASSGGAKLSTVALARGIEYAVATKADIINMSWGSLGQSSTIKSALEVAADSGIVLVASAANYGRDWRGALYAYPASYDDVISVGASDQSDKKTAFSQYNNKIDVLAPGQGIYSCIASSATSYASESGTSMAAPMTAALAALILSKNPDLTPSEVEQIIKTTAVNVDAQNSGFVGRIGSGRINAEAAIIATPAVIADFSISTNQACQLADVGFKDLSRGKGYSYKWSFPDATPSSSTAANPTIKYADTGWYDVQLIVTNSFGADTLLKKDIIHITKPSAQMKPNKVIVFKGRSALIRIDLNGKQPFTVAISDGSNIDTIKNISSNAYFLNVSSDTNITYQLTYMRDADCEGVASGVSKVEVEDNVDYGLSTCTEYTYGKKISDTQGGFTATFSGADRFGYTSCNIGDWDGDGNEDIIVTAHKHTNSTTNGGAIFLLFLDSNQKIKSYQEIGENVGGFNTSLSSSDHFGTSVTLLSDLDNDGVKEIAVGASNDDDGGTDRGAVYILYMKSNGTVKSFKKISSTSGGLTGLANVNYFGISMTNIGDYNQDGTDDIAVGAYKYSSNRGAVFIIGLDTNGTVKFQKILSSGVNGAPSLGTNDYFGTSVKSIGDIDKNGVNDIMVGADGDDDGFTDAGAAYLLLMKKDGTVRRSIKYGNDTKGLEKILDASILFGRSIEVLINDGNLLRVLIGSQGDNSGRGAVWQLDLDTVGSGRVAQMMRIDTDHKSMNGKLSNGDAWGYSITKFYDKNNGSHVAIGSSFDDDGGTDRGSIYLLDYVDSACYNIASCTKYQYKQKVSDTKGDFTVTFNGGDRFGNSSDKLGDWDGDGNQDIVVGAHGRKNSSSPEGGVYMLFLDSDQKVKSYKEIGNGVGGLPKVLDGSDGFGVGLTTIGDLNQDGITDLAVGAFQDDDGGADYGAVYILFMKSDGTVKSHAKISATSGKVTGLSTQSKFGYSVTNIGDFNNDGTDDIAVGAYRHQSSKGAIFVLGLNKNGTVKSQKVISSGSNGMGTYGADYFGSAVECVGDIDSNGINDIVVGAHNNDDGNANAGAVYLLLLKSDGSVKKYVKYSNKTQQLYNRLETNAFLGRSIEHVTTAKGIARIMVGASRTTSKYGAIWHMDIDTLGNAFNAYALTSKHDALKNLNATGELGQCITYIHSGLGKKILVIGSSYDDDGGTNNGSLHILQLQDTCVQDTTPCKVKAKWNITQNCLSEGLSIESLTNGKGKNKLVNLRWNMGDSTTYEGAESINHKYDTAGTYNVELMVSGIHTGSGYPCVDTLSQDIVVKDTLFFTLAERDTMCLNDSLELNVSDISCEKTPLKYTWTPNLYISDTTVSNPIVSPPASMWYYLTLESASSAVVQDSIYVFLDPNCCRNQAVIEVDENQVCQNDTVDLINASIADNASASYDWTFGRLADISSYSGKTPPRIRMIGAGYDTITLIVSDKCGFDTTETVIWVSPAPIMNQFNDTAVCTGDTVRFDFSTVDITNRYSWYPSGFLIDSTSDTPGYVADASQQFIFTLSDDLSGCESMDTVLVEAKPYPVVNLGNDTTLCDNDSLLLSSMTSGASYSWSDGTSDTALLVKSSGDYWLETDLNGCKARDTIKVNYKPNPVVDLGADTFICVGDSLILDARYTGATYQWNDLTTDSTFVVKTTGDYWVDVTLNGCTVSDSISVDERPFPILDLGIDTFICTGDSLILDATYTGATYQWNDMTTNSTQVVKTSGNFWVDVTLNGCTVSDSIAIEERPVPTIDLGTDTFICKGDSLILDATYTGATYQWNDLTNDSTLTIKTGGDYWVDVTLNGCTVSDSISVDERPFPTVNLGTDTFICTGDSLILDATYMGATYQWNDMTMNSTQTVKTGGDYWVTLSLKGCSYSDTVAVEERPVPSVELGNDSFFCGNDSILLDATYTMATYLWNDMTTNASLWARSTGTYSVEVILNACTYKDTVSITQRSLPVVDLGRDTTICSNENLVLNANLAGASYQWNDMSTNPTLAVGQTGLYWVEVTLNQCKSSDSISVSVLDVPGQKLGPDLIACDTVDLLIGPSAEPGYTYRWNNNETTSQIKIYKAGEYWLETANGVCSSFDTVNITLSYSPEFDLGNDTTICNGDKLTLDLSSLNADSYVWQNTSRNSEFLVGQAGIYSLTARKGGCSGTDSIIVDVKDCECVVYFPTAFTPTGDGLNDTYRPIPFCNVKNLHFSVYNRWGVVVYYSTDPNASWDGFYKGEMAMQGVYAVEYYYTYNDNGVSRRRYEHSKVLLLQKYD